MRHLLFLCLAAALLATPTRASQRSDACSLLKEREIESVLGERLVDMKSSRPESRGLEVTFCFYTLRSFEKSVSLEVVRKNPDGPASASPRGQWKELFDRPSSEIGREEGEEGRSVGPERVTDLGDEALWTRDRVGGALYVLKGEAYLRISIGGTDPETVRMRKTKDLARRAIGRL